MTLKIPTTTSPVGDTVEIVRPMTVGDLAAHLRITPADVQRELMKLGILANLNAEVSVENATKVAQARGFKVIGRKKPAPAARCRARPSWSSWATWTTGRPRSWT